MNPMSSLLRYALLPGLALLLLLRACGEQPTAESLMSQIEQDRVQKDRFFKSDTASPLTPKQQAKFSGLNYYPVDLAYHFETTIHEYPQKDTVAMTTTKGEAQEYLRWGWFDFSVNGQSDTLSVYKPVDISSGYPPYFFIPFYDATNNKTTYGGGRYLDVRIHESDDYVIDFNQAYNPYCAYNKDEWSCPIPPVHNRVDFPIRAGEKIIDLD